MANHANFCIVGIGASAGGLEALRLFFENLSLDTGMAFVVMQHRDAKKISLLMQLITSFTKIPVEEVRNDLPLKANHIYIALPNKDLIFNKYKIKLKDFSNNTIPRKPIDAFFTSLSNTFKHNAIGVILSGNGADGTKGLQQINKNGGTIFVQDPVTASYSGMPESAINASVADFILSPKEIAAKLNIYLKNTFNQLNPLKTNNLIDDEKLNQILKIIKVNTGFDFFDYKSSTIIRRIYKRITLLKCNNVEEYIVKLLKNTDEVINLYNEFLIGVTNFFRDQNVYAYFEKKCIPSIVKNCSSKNSIRIWVCGCSTGEEAYSLAILFKEYLSKEKCSFKVLIFASDLNKNAITFSRKGIYPISIADSISTKRLSQYFILKNNQYHVRKEIRDMIVFSHHNALTDPPFSKIDLISCRNLLIYLNSTLQQKLIQKFTFSLVDNGILLLGLSESVGLQVDSFSPINEKLKVFKKNAGSIIKPIQIYQLLNNNQQLTSKPVASNNHNMNKSSITNITQKILLDNYAPPSVIINLNNDALFFSGNTGLYLEPPIGIAKFNIIDMARKGLKIPLQQTIEKVRKSKKEIVVPKVEIILDDSLKLINLKVKPLINKDYEPGSLLVIFEPYKEFTDNLSNTSNPFSEKDKIKFNLLQSELELTSQHLQIAISELETAKEDFKFSSEELQSSNEELETSREELQAVNEELITVNAELTEKIEQMVQSNDDLTNLLRCIELATLYLDKDLLIKRFTPAITKIFQLIPSDIDRPLTHLTSNLYYTNLVDDVHYVLKTLHIKSIEVNAKDGTWYLMRIIPYRTAENSIEGVLITFIDITNQKNAELQAAISIEQLTTISSSLPIITFTAKLSPLFSFDAISHNIEIITGFPSLKFTDKPSFFINRIHADQQKKVETFLNNLTILKKRHIQFQWKCADNSLKKFIIYKKIISSNSDKNILVVGYLQEID